MQFIKLSFWFLLFIFSTCYLTLFTTEGNKFIYHNIEEYVSKKISYDMVVSDMESIPGELKVNLKSRENKNVTAVLTGDYSKSGGEFKLISKNKNKTYEYELFHY